MRSDMRKQAMCHTRIKPTFFLLLAFQFWLRFLETDERPFEIAMWIVFLLGLGGYSLWIAGFEPVSDLVPATSSPPPRPMPPRPGIKA